MPLSIEEVLQMMDPGTLDPHNLSNYPAGPAVDQIEAPAYPWALDILDPLSQNPVADFLGGGAIDYMKTKAWGDEPSLGQSAFAALDIMPGVGKVAGGLGALAATALPMIRREGAQLVSQRFPTATQPNKQWGALQDPMGDYLRTDVESMGAKLDPAIERLYQTPLEQVTVQTSKGPKVVAGGYAQPKTRARSAGGRSQATMESMAENLVWLHDRVPGNVRERSKQWYTGARNLVDDWAPKFGVAPEQVAATIAALSPQKDWFMNVSAAERVLDAVRNRRNVPWDEAMDATARRIYHKPADRARVKKIRGKTLEELSDNTDKAIWVRTYDQAHRSPNYNVTTPEGGTQGLMMTEKGEPAKMAWGSNAEIAKAVQAAESADPAVLSPLLGKANKVRNFYNNIINPLDPHSVTIDTHAVAAGLLRPMSASAEPVAHAFGGGIKGRPGIGGSSYTGNWGAYPIYADAYRLAGRERDILPREMQSITWEAGKGLFTPGFKGQAKNVESVDDVWRQHQRGKISTDQARERIEELAGGIDYPAWWAD